MIYEKTPLGVQAFQQKPSQLSAKLRSILIMVDGKRSAQELNAVLSAIGAGQGQLDELMQLGLIRMIEGANPGVVKSAKPGDNGVAAASIENFTQLSDQERYQRAYPIATKLTSGLGLKGFRLNLAVEGAGNIQDLIALSEKIKDAVGDGKFAELKPYLWQ